MDKSIMNNEIFWPKSGKRMRKSSYDTDGGNKDFIVLEPGNVKTIFESNRPGIIRHIWITLAPHSMKTDEDYLYRKLVVRMYWDGEKNPSVQAPIGDFFGIGHGIVKNYTSYPFQMAPEDGKSLNCFLPMPFEQSARIEIECNTQYPLKFYYYIDYEDHEKGDLKGSYKFHAYWKREIAKGVDENSMDNIDYEFGGENTDGKENYVILEAEGKGHYIGCNMNIHNLRFTREWNWYGEGDDMIFIDGESWPPRLHGTGTEDYFNTAWCPTQEYNSPYFGINIGGGPNWSGKVSYYRYHIKDPVMFDKSIKVTIEHGHNNHRSDDYSSTAYWYQQEPHKKFGEIAKVEDRIPLDDIIGLSDEKLEKVNGKIDLSDYED